MSRPTVSVSNCDPEKPEVNITSPPLLGGGFCRIRGVSSNDRPAGPCEDESSWGIGFEICLGALMVGRFFLFPPLLSDIFDRSSDMLNRVLSLRGADWVAINRPRGGQE